MEEVVYVSGRVGKIRVDYNASKGSLLETFEDFREGTLRTGYSRDGRVIDREFTNMGRSRDLAAKRAAGLGVAMTRVEYEEVRIGKPCPHCGGSISLFTEEHNIPIMPIYICASCNGRSIDLTDEYLAKLVMENRGLFDSGELAELAGNPNVFNGELKGYIIKIYASKHIAKI